LPFGGGGGLPPPCGCWLSEKTNDSRILIIDGDTLQVLLTSLDAVEAGVIWVMSRADGYPVMQGATGPIWKIAKGVRVRTKADGTI